MSNEFGPCANNLNLVIKNNSTEKATDHYYNNGSVPGLHTPLLPSHTSADIPQSNLNAGPMPWNYNPYFGNFYNYYTSPDMSDVSYQYNNQKCNTQFPYNYQQPLPPTSVLQCCDPRCQFLSEHTKYPFTQPLCNKLGSPKSKRSRSYYTGYLNLPKPDITSKSLDYPANTSVMSYASSSNDLSTKYSSQQMSYSTQYQTTVKSSKSLYLAESVTYTDIGKPYWNKQNFWNPNISSAHYPHVEQDKNVNSNFQLPLLEQSGISSNSTQYKNNILYNHSIDSRGISYDASHIPEHSYISNKQTHIDNSCEHICTNNHSNNHFLSHEIQSSYNSQFVTNNEQDHYYKELVLKSNNKNIKHHVNKSPNLDVREFLSTWDEEEDDKLVDNETPVIVIDCTSLEAKEKENSVDTTPSFNHTIKIDDLELPCSDANHDVAALKPESVAAYKPTQSTNINSCDDKLASDSRHLNSDGFLTWYSNSKKKSDCCYNLVEMTERFVNTVDKLFSEPRKKYTLEENYVWNSNHNCDTKDHEKQPLVLLNDNQESRYMFEEKENLMSYNKFPIPVSVMSEHTQKKTIPSSSNLERPTKNDTISNPPQSFPTSSKSSKAQDYSIKYRANQECNHFQNEETINLDYSHKTITDHNAFSFADAYMNETNNVISKCSLVDYIETNTINNLDITSVNADLEKSLIEVSFNKQTQKTEYSVADNTTDFSIHCVNSVTNASEFTTVTSGRLSSNGVSNPDVDMPSYNSVIHKTGACDSKICDIDEKNDNCKDNLLSMPSLSPPGTSSTFNNTIETTASSNLRHIVDDNIGSICPTITESQKSNIQPLDLAINKNSIKVCVENCSHKTKRIELSFNQNKTIDNDCISIENHMVYDNKLQKVEENMDFQNFNNTKCEEVQHNSTCIVFPKLYKNELEKSESHSLGTEYVSTNKLDSTLKNKNQLSSSIESNQLFNESVSVFKHKLNKRLESGDRHPTSVTACERTLPIVCNKTVLRKANHDINSPLGTDHQSEENCNKKEDEELQRFEKSDHFKQFEVVFDGDYEKYSEYEIKKTINTAEIYTSISRGSCMSVAKCELTYSNLDMAPKFSDFSRKEKNCNIIENIQNPFRKTECEQKKSVYGDKDVSQFCALWKKKLKSKHKKRKHKKMYDDDDDDSQKYVKRTKEDILDVQRSKACTIYLEKESVIKENTNISSGSECSPTLKQDFEVKISNIRQKLPTDTSLFKCDSPKGCDSEPEVEKSSDYLIQNKIVDDNNVVISLVDNNHSISKNYSLDQTDRLSESLQETSFNTENLKLGLHAITQENDDFHIKKQGKTFKDVKKMTNDEDYIKNYIFFENYSTKMSKQEKQAVCNKNLLGPRKPIRRLSLYEEFECSKEYIPLGNQSQKLCRRSKSLINWTSHEKDKLFQIHHPYKVTPSLITHDKNSFEHLPYSRTSYPCFNIAKKELLQIQPIDVICHEPSVVPTCQSDSQTQGNYTACSRVCFTGDEILISPSHQKEEMAYDNVDQFEDNNDYNIPSVAPTPHCDLGKEDNNNNNESDLVETSCHQSNVLDHHEYHIPHIITHSPLFNAPSTPTCDFMVSERDIKDCVLPSTRTTPSSECNFNEDNEKIFSIAPSPCCDLNDIIVKDISQDTSIVSYQSFTILSPASSVAPSPQCDIIDGVCLDKDLSCNSNDDGNDDNDNNNNCSSKNDDNNNNNNHHHHHDNNDNDDDNSNDDNDDDDDDDDDNDNDNDYYYSEYLHYEMSPSKVEVPSLQSLAFEVLKSIETEESSPAKHNLLEVWVTPEHTKIIIHSEDQYATGILLSNEISDSRNVDTSVDCDVSQEYAENLGNQCLIISNKESIIFLHCTEEDTNKNTLDTNINNTNNDFHTLDECIEESFIDQNISCSPPQESLVLQDEYKSTHGTTTASFVEMSQCKTIYTNPLNFQMKVQLPWHKIFNLGDCLSNYNESAIQELELGPAQIEVQLMSDGSEMVDVRSKFISPILQVKRLILQPAINLNYHQYSLKLGSQNINNENEGLEEESNERERFLSENLYSSVKSSNLNVREIVGVPKMLIKKTSCQEYQSYLQVGKALQPIVRLNRSRSLDELALKLTSTDSSSYHFKLDNELSKDEEVNRHSVLSGQLLSPTGSPLKNTGTEFYNKLKDVTVDNGITLFSKAVAEQHHCLLCHRSYSSKEVYHLHLKSKFHRHLELMQRKTIHAMYRHFTGQLCPRLQPLSIKERKKMKWKPRNSNVNHFYHQKTPLQIALHKSPIHHKT